MPPGPRGARFVRAPVGEANVARAIRDERAIIGGEGNGGVMLPALHIGRDAPLGVALILHLLAATGVTLSQLVAAAPRYTIVKAKGPRGSDLRLAVRVACGSRFPDAAADERDGLRLAWPDRWLHVRPSGTEPIVRLIAEAPTEADAEGADRGRPRTLVLRFRRCAVSLATSDRGKPPDCCSKDFADWSIAGTTPPASPSSTAAGSRS